MQLGHIREYDQLIIIGNGSNLAVTASYMAGAFEVIYSKGLPLWSQSLQRPSEHAQSSFVRPLVPSQQAPKKVRRTGSVNIV